VFVTNDRDEVLSISSLVRLMNHGKPERVADPQVLYSRPSTLFAARFVGAGTFLDAQVIGRSAGTVTVDVKGLRLSAADAGVEPGRPAQVLLRPEDLALDVGGSAGRAGRSSPVPSSAPTSS
jgi:ABC-type Fe3+/spermidine/putrescine transport system ATPase subunit